MAKYKMKFFGSLNIDGSTVHFDKDQVIDSNQPISEEYGEKMKSERKTSKKGKVEAETAALDHEMETR